MVQMRGIVKKFDDLVANNQIDLQVETGEIHALLGENGAGKTTLMNVLYGLLQADEGTIEIEGRLVKFAGPGDAISAGIGMVHQHPLLVERLTVVENLFLGGVGNGTVKGLRQAIEAIEKRYPLNVDPEAVVEDLPMSQRQRVEIIRCLARGIKVLVLDEPTAVLTVDEVDDLFDEMRLIVEAGNSVIFISHKLSEVGHICDRVTVLRGGSKVGTYLTADTDATALAHAMVGEKVVAAHREGIKQVGAPRLSLRACSVHSKGERPLLDKVDLDIREGEIVGVAGVEGNGQKPMAALAQGMYAPTSGEILLDGDPLPPLSEWRDRSVGIGRIPEDRRREGLTMDATLWENLLTGPQAPEVGRIFSKRKMVEHARGALEEFGVSPPDPFVTAEQLSGGNQQKVVLARELWSNPGVVVAVNPTRGLDLRAQHEIHKRFLNLREQGVAVLMISTDLDEITAISDRIAVLYEGNLKGPFLADLIDRNQIGLLMAGIECDPPVPSGGEGLL